MRQAPRVPVGYEICKSCGHSAMAVYQLTAPYLDNPKDPSWRTPMTQYLALQEATLAGFDGINLSEDAKKSAIGFFCIGSRGAPFSRSKNNPQKTLGEVLAA